MGEWFSNAYLGKKKLYTPKCIFFVLFETGSHYVAHAVSNL
jgi:hypothetical protein